MNLQELTKEYGSIELSYEIEKNFLDEVIDRVEAELELDDNSSNLMQSIIKFGTEFQDSDLPNGFKHGDKNIISNLNDWINSFEPSDYYFDRETGDFDRETVREDAYLLNEIAGDCEEAIMDAVKNQGDADWQLAYEAFARIALIIEDIDFNIEELGLDKVEEELNEKKNNERKKTMKESYLYEIDFYGEPLTEKSIQYLKDTVTNALIKDYGYDEDLVKDILENCDCGATGDSFISSLCELKEIYNSRCGMAGGYAGMIYYSDTNAFFDKHCDAISDMIEKVSDSFGDDSWYAQFGKKFIQDGEQTAKNWATFLVFEEVAHTVMDSIEVDSDKIKYKSEVTNKTKKRQ